MPGIECAEEMSDDEINLGGLVLVIIISIGCLVLWALSSGWQHQAMQLDADKSARCNSLGGSYSGDKCYMDGEEV